MSRSLLYLLALALVAGTFWRAPDAGRLEPRAAPPLPSRPASWLGQPQSWTALRGRVVLLDVWTFG